MRSFIDPFFIAVSMYSIVPVPMVEWNEQNVKMALVFFPFVGVICGAAVCAMYIICNFFQVNSFMGGTMCALASVLMTGGIHFDGFCDTADAMFSRRSTEEKLRIMKDPNCGPFAVICAAAVIMIQCAAYSMMYEHPRALAVMCAVQVMSRALSGISVTMLPIAPTSSLARTFGENVPKRVKVLLGLIYAAAACGAVLLHIPTGAASAAVCLCVTAIYALSMKKNFGGITGDTAGYFLILCETAAAAVIALLSGRLL